MVLEANENDGDVVRRALVVGERRQLNRHLVDDLTRCLVGRDILFF